MTPYLKQWNYNRYLIAKGQADQVDKSSLFKIKIQINPVQPKRRDTISWEALNFKPTVRDQTIFKLDES